MKKSFRGLLADGGQDRIRLQTKKGKVGYRIVNFELISYKPVNVSHASVAMIWKTQQSSVPTDTPIIDFTDSSLLAAGMLTDNASLSYAASKIIVFDQEIFNQDIYITHTDQEGTASLNYYLELEAIALDDKSAEYTTIKDLRGYTNINPWR